MDHNGFLDLGRTRTIKGHRLAIFAAASREQGVEMVASSCAARGIDSRRVSQAAYRLRQKGVRVEPKVDAELSREIDNFSVQVKPWEQVMMRRNRMEREAYREAARSCYAGLKTANATRQAALLQAARDLEAFARAMPTPKNRVQKALDRTRAAAGMNPIEPTQDRDCDLER